ncbi:MAG: EpsI family protein [Candidatus Omnitrophica bacterium]|nr:EpsI family protein [Candidatus Omnitrophota bacterium]
MKNQKLFIIIGLFVISGIVSWSTYLKEYTETDTVNIHLFPKEINGWVAEEVPITDDEYAILETKNVFIRRYTNAEGKEVFLFMIYSQRNRKVSHPPEVCYTGSGMRVASNEIDNISVPNSNLIIPAHKLGLEYHQYKQIAYYWFKVGESFTPSYFKQQIMIAANNFFGKPKSSALIRVSATVSKDEASVVSDIKEFSTLIIPYIFQYLP